jgi:radical SAM superfamily enzyme YgiQ (UPF0313 family)
MTKPLVILVYPKIDHEKDYVYFWMPFSLLTIAKVILDDDLADVAIFDGNQSSTADWESFLDDNLSRTICIGVSIMTGGGQIAHAVEMVKTAAARPNCPPVVWGGPHVNVLPEQTLADPIVNTILVGPGQNSMPSYIRALMGRLSLQDVPGLMNKSGSVLIKGPENPPRTQQLGGYPWGLLSVADYIRNDPTVATRTLNYVSSQGCIYKCKFCYELTYKRKYSAIDADTLLDEIESLKDKFDINGVKFYDADWFVNLRRAAAFSRGLIERKINISWAASINPNDVLKAREKEPDLMNLLRDSGCSRLLMGVESGSDRVLNEIVEKEITRDKILNVAEEIARFGIMGSYTFIVGFPGETADEQESTYDLIEQLRGLSPQPETRVHLFAPYPGTPLYERSLSYGFVPPSGLADWARYDYYDSLTPWTDADTVQRARSNTHMRLKAGSEC